MTYKTQSILAFAVSCVGGCITFGPNLPPHHGIMGLVICVFGLALKPDKKLN